MILAEPKLHKSRNLSLISHVYSMWKSRFCIWSDDDITDKLLRSKQIRPLTWVVKICKKSWREIVNPTITIPTMRTSNVKDKFVYEDFLQLQKWKQSSLKMKNYAELNPINRKSKSSKFKYFWKFVKMVKIQRFLKFVKMIKIQIFFIDEISGISVKNRQIASKKLKI